MDECKHLRDLCAIAKQIFTATNSHQPQSGTHLYGVLSHAEKHTVCNLLATNYDLSAHIYMVSLARKTPSVQFNHDPLHTFIRCP